MKTTHQLCEGRFRVAVGVSLDKSSVADCSCSKWSKSIVSQALRSRIEEGWGYWLRQHVLTVFESKPTIQRPIRQYKRKEFRAYFGRQ